MADKSQVEYILADIRSITENMIIKRKYQYNLCEGRRSRK